MIYDQDLPAENASERSVAIENYVASVEEYSHKPYFTRDTLSMNKSLIGSRLTSYGPQSNQLFSLTFDSTYFDIPGRAPRWATHSGTDYHGKLCSALREFNMHLMQISMQEHGYRRQCAGTLIVPLICYWNLTLLYRSLLRYTKKDERILSNFLGRGIVTVSNMCCTEVFTTSTTLGTDAIECFLLQRK